MNVVLKFEKSSVNYLTWAQNLRKSMGYHVVGMVRYHLATGLTAVIIGRTVYEFSPNFLHGSYIGENHPIKPIKSELFTKRKCL